MDLEAESAAITVDTGKSKDIAKSCKSYWIFRMK
jgi:hypothetical protein